MCQYVQKERFVFVYVNSKKRKKNVFNRDELTKHTYNNDVKQIVLTLCSNCSHRWNAHLFSKCILVLLGRLKSICVTIFSPIQCDQSIRLSLHFFERYFNGKYNVVFSYYYSNFPPSYLVLINYYNSGVIKIRWRGANVVSGHQVQHFAITGFRVCINWDSLSIVYVLKHIVLAKKKNKLLLN